MKNELINLLKNLNNNHLNKKEKLEILSWAEKNLNESIPEFLKYQPEYVYKEFGKYYMMSFTLIKDLNLY